MAGQVSESLSLYADFFDHFDYFKWAIVFIIKFSRRTMGFDVHHFEINLVTSSIFNGRSSMLLLSKGIGHN
jgi:hypothetical protein